jgi:hypothetical protein
MPRLVSLASLLLALTSCTATEPDRVAVAPTPAPPPLVVRDAAVTAPPADAATGCLRDEGGCKQPPSPIAACAAGTNAITVAQLVKDRARYQGKQVTVRGPLNRTGFMCTELGCPGRECCNTCIGQLVLGPPDPNLKTAFLLRGGTGSLGDRDPLDCLGDESMVCCPYATNDQDVIVTATLTAPVSSPREPAYLLVNATLCAP